MKLANASFLLISCLIACQAWAHHGPVGSAVLYDRSRLVVLEGELTEIFWRNPHVRFRIGVPGDTGDGIIWELEFAGTPAGLPSRGLRPELAQVGDQVKVAGWVSKRYPSSLGVSNILLANGQEYAQSSAKLMWSSRRAQGSQQRPADRAPTVTSEQATEGIFRVWGMEMRPSEWMATHNYDHLLTAAGREAKADFDPVSHPILDCVPRGMPERMLPSSMEFVDEGKRVIMRHFWWGGDRIIHLDSDEASAGTPHSHLGYSVGYWENKDTLVVRTTHVNYPYFERNGTPQTDQVEFVERFTLSANEARLGYELTATDPMMYAEPIVVYAEFTWVPGAVIETSNCELWNRSGN